MQAEERTGKIQSVSNIIAELECPQLLANDQDICQGNEMGLKPLENFFEDCARTSSSLTNRERRDPLGESLLTPMLSQSYFMCMRPSKDNHLFRFFLEQAPFILSVNLPQTLGQDPFFNYFPHLALNHSVVMKAVLTFSASQIDRLQQAQSTKLREQEVPSTNNLVEMKQTYPIDTQVPRLLKETMKELIPRLSHEKYKCSDETVSALFILAASDMCFCCTDALSGRTKAFTKWQKQLNVAKSLLYQKKSDIPNLLDDSFFPDDGSSLSFFTLWMDFIEIIGSISRPTPLLNKESLSFASYRLQLLEDDDVILRKRGALKDIHECTGLEYRILSYLGEVAILIKKIMNSENGLNASIVTEALELEEEIMTYLETGERQREEIIKNGNFAKTQLQFYDTLRAINLVQCLSGVLQIKRRVVGLTFSSPIIKKLLKRITNIVKLKIGYFSCAESSIMFCLFVCGCDLIDYDMIEYRKVYVDHLTAMNKNGLISAHHGLLVMYKCWRTKRPWWEVMQEMGMDLSFAI